MTDAVILQDAHGRRCAVPRAAVEWLEPLGGVREVVCAVAEAAGIRPSRLMGRERCVMVARPRQVIYWLAQKRTGKGPVEIGRYVGGRDHSTITKGIAVIDAILAGRTFRERITADECRYVCDLIARAEAILNE